jgi:hypothetical protein
MSFLSVMAEDAFHVPFIMGHSHQRDYTMLDQSSASGESGKFIVTIGLCSFPNAASVKLAKLQQQQVDTYPITTTATSVTATLNPYEDGTTSALNPNEDGNSTSNPKAVAAQRNLMLDDTT